MSPPKNKGQATSTEKSRGGRPSKYKPATMTGVSQEQNDLIDQIINGRDHTQESGKPLKADGLSTDGAFDISKINEDYVLQELHRMGSLGNVKALELLGDKLGLFDNKVKEGLIDVFIDEGSLEQGIEKLLVVLEDKYPNITADIILSGNIERDLDALIKADQDDLDAEEEYDDEDLDEVTPLEKVGATIDPTSKIRGATRPTLSASDNTGGERDLQAVSEPEGELFLPTGSLSFDPPIDQLGLEPRIEKKNTTKLDGMLDAALARSARKRS